jgi:ribosomal-protein-alanine N-acetyltransferase
MSILERMLERAATRPLAIEPLRVRHIGQVMAIERDAYPRPWTAQVFHDELREARAGHRHYVVARRGRHVVGYGGAMFVGGGHQHTADEAHVTNIAVLARERRAGVATRLLVALARTAIERGCEAWTLEVRATSPGAQALYRRFGFVPAGVRKNYYEEETDAIVMWCHDIQSADYAQRLEELASR